MFQCQRKPEPPDCPTGSWKPIDEHRMAMILRMMWVDANEIMRKMRNGSILETSTDTYRWMES